jgi:N-acetyl-gamma-glutamyl-phosphate reductase
MIRAAVAGATGYAGAELVRLLTGHPGVRLTMITSRQFAGQRFDRVFPSMSGRVDLVCEELNDDRICAAADVIFTALPHKLPMNVAPEILKRGRKMIDLSADFRFNAPEIYESVYQPHTSPGLLKESAYGLSEVYSAEIASARLVGNPGCYPTSLLLPLVPLIRAGMVDLDGIVVDSKSGVSGAGRSPSLTVHYCEVNESFKAYKVAVHRHAPEMEAVLSREARTPVQITFVPHLVPLSRGMLTTVYARPDGSLTAQKVKDCLTSFYAGRPFVRLRPPGAPPDTLHVRGTNYCDIGFVLDERTRRLILMSAIDNLGKGAAGQAVQNLNLMFGLEETAGLDQIPFAL